MEPLERKRSTKINEILAITCIVGVMLLFVGIIDVVPSIPFAGKHIPIYVFAICLVAYALWFIITKYQANIAEPKLSDFVLITITLFAIIFFIYQTDAHESTVKTILIIPLTIVSIRYGLQGGIFAATLSTIGIAVIDLTNHQNMTFNPILQSDIVLAGTLFVIAWVIGNFTETEKEIRNYLIDMANIDELTGLYNHRSFQERLASSFNQAAATNRKLSLIIFDVDYFKHYNDLYGHQKGDAVLADIAATMRRHAREQDTVARYGGEEFAFVMPDTEPEAAVAVAEAVRKDIEAQPFFGVREQPGGKLTVSAGIATFPNNAQNKEELIRMADMALYQAKYTSKNKVELYFSVLDSLKKDLDLDELSLLNTIKTLINVINAKDRYTFGHSGRVMNYSITIARKAGLSEEEIKTIRYSAFLHDVGKIEISREILNKHDPLTEEEQSILKKHPEWGADIIRPVSALKDAVPAILHHHEWFNGKGYPAGITGEQIPVTSRILCIADSIDAMSTDRPYKKRKNLAEIKRELLSLSGTQFDPVSARLTLELLESGELQLEQSPQSAYTERIK
ncbi:MAG: diguanylate cyclase [bacterium]|jgi:diguanylate cyclase (GGDEF)-like protein